MASRRRSVAVAKYSSSSEAPRSTSSRRASSTTGFRKLQASFDSFTDGEAFDFGPIIDSPKGPMTRSRRSSIYVGKAPLNKGLPLINTSTRKKAPTKSRLGKVVEEETTKKTAAKKQTKPKMDTKTSLKRPTVINKTAGRKEVNNEKTAAPKKGQITPRKKAVVQLKKLPLGLNKTNKTPVHVSPELNRLLEDVAEVKERLAKTPLKNTDPNEIFERLEEVQAKADRVETVLTHLQEEIKAAVVMSATKKSGKKPAGGKPNKSIKLQPAAVFCGTPQQADPGNVLRRNLKRRIDNQIEQRVSQMPQESSPYKMLIGETENGSPVEHFVRVNQKPCSTFVTGTPMPPKRRILQDIAQNQASSSKPSSGSPHPLKMTPNTTNRRSSSRFNMNKPKLQQQDNVMANNTAVNKTMNNRVQEVDKQAAATSSSYEMVTGDLASMCLVM